MAVQNALHRVHLASAPPATLMTGTTTQIMIDIADLLRGPAPEAKAAIKARLSGWGLRSAVLPAAARRRPCSSCSPAWNVSSCRRFWRWLESCFIQARLKQSRHGCSGVLRVRVRQAGKSCVFSGLATRLEVSNSTHRIEHGPACLSESVVEKGWLWQGKRFWWSGSRLYQLGLHVWIWRTRGFSPSSMTIFQRSSRIRQMGSCGRGRYPGSSAAR